MTELKTFTATIGRQNEHGFQIDERPGIWLNLSKFADPPPVIPPLGSTARITVDDKHFVRAIEPQEPTSAPRNAVAPTGERDRTITRLAVLKAAARFLADKSERTSADVLVVATAWETWITRPEAES